jgi:nucleotide-binding universal stress UspA family protein
MLTRLLASLDGSPATDAIIPALRQLVGGTGALVHLLVVRPPVRLPDWRGDRLPSVEEVLIPGVLGMPLRSVRPEPRPYLDTLLARESATWLTYLRRIGSALAYDGVVVQHEIRFGDPFRETLAVAERHALNLIVLEAQPQSWVERLWRPSLAQKLLAQPDVPVLTVPPVRPTQRGGALRFDRALS